VEALLYFEADPSNADAFVAALIATERGEPASDWMTLLGLAPGSTLPTTARACSWMRDLLFYRSGSRAAVAWENQCRPAGDEQPAPGAEPPLR
jgi:hypothetical protein